MRPPLPSFLVVLLLQSPALAQLEQPARPRVAVPAPAAVRVAAAEVRIVPDHADWTYQPGERVTFHVEVLWDRQPIDGVEVRYTVGPEMMPTVEVPAIVPRGGLKIDGGTLDRPGFIRCVVKATVGDRSYRALATAGFSPERIEPTQVDPKDFDSFWANSLAELAEVPLAPEIQLLPEESRGAINVYHVSFRTWQPNPSTSYRSRMYGILCEPKHPGRYPAIVRLPSAGLRPHTGVRELAEKGAITLEIGAHGMPVTYPRELYDQIRAAALDGYPVYHLDSRERYYFRRVYLGCIRANDFITTRPMWDGRTLLVTGGSQGGQLTLMSAALDARVTAAAAYHPAYCDVTGYLHGRAGGWPHMFRDPQDGHRTSEKIAVTAYYDTVNFARRLRVPVLLAFGYNDETCPPTSLVAAYNAIPRDKQLLRALEAGHFRVPEVEERVTAWLVEKAQITTAPPR